MKPKFRGAARALFFGILCLLSTATRPVPLGAQNHWASLDPRFEHIVPRASVLEKIADGFQWVEGPVWNRKESYLLFSDIPTNTVFKWQAESGIKVFLKPSGYSGSTPFLGKEPGSNGLAFDQRNRLILAEHGDRRISRLETDGRKTTLVDRYKGKRLNSPNDLVFHSNGDLYFTDPPFGLPMVFYDPQKELDFSGVYRLSRKRELTLLIKHLKAPNGIALSPDEKTLYVTDVDPAHAAWLRYELTGDGRVASGRLFFSAKKWQQSNFGGPDGLEVDSRGNLFASRPGGINVFSPDGTLLGCIEIGRPTSNLAWGDDGSSLYITAGTAIYRIRLTTRGVNF